MILGDWGSTTLRLWRMRDGEIVDSRRAPGLAVSTVAPAQVLATAIGGWEGLSVLLCGMAGARGGLCEAGYADTPADAAGWRRGIVNAGDGIRVLPGVAGTNAFGAPDVMRGEEAQVFGALAVGAIPTAGRTLAITPGTHSKWIEVCDSRIERITTVPTGEIFAGLKMPGGLLGEAQGIDQPADEDGFDFGLERAKQVPAAVPAVVFETRSRQIREGRDARWAAGYLSGVLICAEIEAMKFLAEGWPVVVIGEGSLSGLYLRALGKAGISARAIDGSKAAVDGLSLVEQLS